ncbi:hypothetical protein B0H10DRAFT_2026906, partial [Mycena sp. CBHHK59/15]
MSIPSMLLLQLSTSGLSYFSPSDIYIAHSLAAKASFMSSAVKDSTVLVLVSNSNPFSWSPILGDCGEGRRSSAAPME